MFGRFQIKNPNTYNVPGLDAPWPHIIISATSPFLMRMAAGTDILLHHRLTPSQILETSLPVTLVLAILAMCWSVPLFGLCWSIIRMTPAPSRYGPYDGDAVPHVGPVELLLLLASPFLAGTLALLLASFRNRGVGGVSVVLAAVLAVRQCARHGLAKPESFTTLICAAVALLLLGARVWRRPSAVKPPAI